MEYQEGMALMVRAAPSPPRISMAIMQRIILAGSERRIMDREYFGESDLPGLFFAKGIGHLQAYRRGMVRREVKFKSSRLTGLSPER